MCLQVCLFDIILSQKLYKIQVQQEPLNKAQVILLALPHLFKASFTHGMLSLIFI